MKAEAIVTLINPHGLHGRPAATFVKTAAQFTSTIRVFRGEKSANAKSPIDVLNLQAKAGEIRITADGDDAETAVATLAELAASGFGEAE